MNRFVPRSRPIALTIALAGALLCPLPSVAQTTDVGATADTPAPVSSDDGNTLRLSDAQRDKILDESTEDSAAAARGELTGPERTARGIHGEVGIMIGTNGTRGAYGAADIPLGENAAASISVETSRFGFPRQRR